MKLPTEQQCMALFGEYNVPKHILEHCLKVREVAVFLAGRLREKGVKINLELIDKGALLHDFLKVVALNNLNESYMGHNYSEEEIRTWKQLRNKYPKMKEGEATYLFLKDDYPELALLIKDFSDYKKISRNLEEMILIYADAIVLRNNIVSLNERKSYIKERYGFSNTNSFFQTITEYEEIIMKEIGLEPEKLAGEITNGKRLL
jgi:HD superfamily phosphodiesterase